MPMLPEEERNQFSIWNRLKSNQGDKIYTAKEKKDLELKWRIGSFIILYLIELEIFESLCSLGGIFGSYEATTNPFTILFKGLTKHPIWMIIMIAAAYFASQAIAKSKVKSIDAEYVYVDRDGDKVVKNSKIASRGVLTTEEESRIFDLRDDLGEPAGVVCGVNRENGKIIVKRPNDTDKDFKWRLKNDNVLVAAPSGGGKSYTVLITSAIEHARLGHGEVIFDPKGEVFKKTVATQISLGRKTRLINFKDGELTHSDGIDILKLIKSAESDAIAIEMTDSLVQTILENTGDIAFWNKSNINFLTLLILYVTRAEAFVPAEKFETLTDESKPTDFDSDRTWREVMKMLTSSSDKVTIPCLELAIANNPHDKELLEPYFNTWKNNKEYKQIQSSLSTTMSVFRNPSVVDILSSDDISFDDLTDGNTTIYVCCSGRKETYKAVLTLFINQMFDRIMTIAEKTNDDARLDNMVFVMLEEFSNLGRIDNLEKVLSQNRSYNISVMLCLQNIPQLEKYNTKENPKASEDIKGACQLQLCLGANEGVGRDGGVSGDTASYFASRSGFKPRMVSRTSEHRNKLLSDKLQDAFVLEQNKVMEEKREQVYHPDDIQNLKPGEIFISPGNYNCVIEDTYPLDEHPFSGLYAIDKETGEEVVFNTSRHTPIGKGGKEYSLENYDIGNRKLGEYKKNKKSYVESSDEGHSEDDFLI